MNRSELIEQLSGTAGISAEGARLVVEALFGNTSRAGIIATTLSRGERVQLSGFGTFEVRRRKERLGRNPQTKEKIVIPAGVLPAFRAGSGFKAQLR